MGRFREGLYGCLTARRDVVFELGDAVLCSPGRVEDLARLSLPGVFTRGHGGLYAGINHAGVDADGLRELLATQVPRFPGGRVVLTVDVSNWLRPDAGCCPERLFCHTYARGRGQSDMVPGWPYSFVAALEPGAQSWVALLDVARIRPGDDPTVVTAAQVRRVVSVLTGRGVHRDGDPDVLVVFDAGYDLTRLSWLLGDCPVQVCGRVRSDRVYHRRPERQAPGRGRPARHGQRIKLNAAEPSSADVSTVRAHPGYGLVRADGFAGVHQRLAHRDAWAAHPGALPIVEGTLVRIRADRLPGNRNPKPLWLWTDRVGADAATMDSWWMAYLRRFDIEHTFRFLKQHLGWARPMLRDPDAADVWTWLILACHTQLRLARRVAADIRLPWQPRLGEHRLTPARVRTDYPRLHHALTHPTRPPKNNRPGPGRPPGSKNRVKPPTQPIGKTKEG